MDLNKLLGVLRTQEKNLKNLFKIGMEKQEILLKNDFEKLNEIVSREEQLLLSIQLTEENRLNIMQSLFELFQIDNERYKLEILVNNLKNRVDEQILQDIESFEKRIKTSIESVGRLNHLNMVLIQQSRSLISETVKAVINNSTKSILDRKG